MRTISLVLIFTAALLAQGKRSITETDIYNFRWAADPQISPDGSQIAYTGVAVNGKKDGYDTAVWLVPTKPGTPPRQITAGPRDGSPRWSPDGKTIVFTRAPEKGGAQLWLLPMTGGEARQLTDLAKGAGNPSWSPDGKSIAFTSTTNAEDLAAKKAGEEPSDVRVITRAVYRANGAGYNDYTRPAHIWVIDVPAAHDQPQKARQITNGRFAENEFVWSRDGAKLYFVSNRDLEPYYQPASSTIFEVDASGGEPRTLSRTDGAARGLAISPDGSRLAFIASPNGKQSLSYSQPDLFVVSLQPGSTPRNLTTKFDNDIGAGIGGDQHPPRGADRATPFWSPDGRYVFAIATEEGKANLKRIDTEAGAVDAVTDAAHDIYSLTATRDAKLAAVAISTPMRIGDIFALDTATKKLTQITDINGPLFTQLNITEPETIWYKSFDGRRVQAWVQRPPDFDAKKKYPIILNIHGGPHSAYGYTFDHEFQWMAAKGYVVLYPNPRGSTSYGQEFGNLIQYKYPGDDVEDLMAGVDELLRRGIADPERLGVTGGSGGGILTNWIVTKTNRFKAAVSQRSIADWSSLWYTSDFVLFQPTWFRGAPWQEAEDFRARSPITFVEKVQTPILFIEGEQDLRTPPTGGGEMMFRALKYLKRPTAMVQFPGESHELSRSGKPRHRVERLQHILAWFDKYLLGQPITTYDVN